MVRNVRPVQRFSPDVVDGAPATASVAYLPGIYGKIGAYRDRPLGGQEGTRAATGVQSWTLKRPCRAPAISRENCAWLM